MNIMFVYAILNGFINYTGTLSSIGFRIPGRNTRNLDLFYIPKFNIYNDKSSLFFSRALINKLSSFLDFSVILRHVFKAKPLLLLKHEMKRNFCIFI